MNVLATDPLASAQRMVEACVHRSIDEIEARMLKMPQAECPVVHHFGPGIYIREVRLPAGAIAIGHRQRCDHMNVMIKGRVRMLNEDGTTTDAVAPLIFVGKPGRKIGYVIEDVVWQNIYATDETDIETLERTYLDKSPAFLDHYAKRLSAPYADHDADRKDYALLLDECGIPHELARAQSENEDDQTKMPHGSFAVMVANSTIEGKGLFATSDIQAGELIAPARILGFRTPAGRFTNHSAQPNAQMVLRDNGDIDLFATAKICGCRGGESGEEITIDYRQALSLSGVKFNHLEVPCQG